MSPGGVSATRRHLRYDATGRPAEIVDVRFGEQRIWSTDSPLAGADGRATLTWPAALRPYLRGATTVTVTSSADGVVIAQGTVRFSRGGQVDVTDAHGSPLTVNKWLRMGTTFEARGNDARTVLLRRTRELVDLLEDLSYEVCITGGTLLGAVRSGSMLPHDDDTDLAVVLPFSDPADLALANYALEDQLARSGLTVVRHSTAHLQIVFLHADGETEHYIDIFTAYFRSGEYCQPFHVRAPLARASILPRRELVLDGVSFPAPAVPEDWLRLCYGPGWRTPDSSFRFLTPRATRRRFESWFGSQNQHRVFWETYWAKQGHVTELVRRPRTELRDIDRALPHGANVLDLGAGDGALAAHLVDRGRRVVAVDYSFRAIELLRSRTLSRRGMLDVRYLNLGDRRRALQLAAELMAESPRWGIVARHVLESLSPEALDTTLLMARELLGPAGVMVATVDTSISLGFAQGDPRTWNLTVPELTDSAAHRGLTATVIRRGVRRTSAGLRRTATVSLTRNGR